MPTSTKGKNHQAPAAPERRSEDKGRTAKIGNLCRDPELRFAQSGQAYAQCRLAVEEPVTPGDWSGERTTTFYDLTVFGQMAEHLAQCCPKGTRVVVIGRATMEYWTDPEKGEQSTKKILADGIGPDLRWATATVEKVKRTGPAAGGNAPPVYDEKPF